MNFSNGCKKTSLITRQEVGQWFIGLPLFGRLIPWFQLTKVSVCLLVSFSTLFGFVLATPVHLGRAMVTFLGMLLLSCGGAALNSLQEITLDASMVRTRNRPLPSGRIKKGPALLLALLLITSGIGVFSFLISSPIAAGLGIVAVVLYNLVYTTMKTKTVIAIIPGAVSGALPPYIGWVAGGGAPFSATAFLVGVLFILWQVPHSLLILLHHKEDYEKNPMPSLIKLFPVSSIRRLFLIWAGSFFLVLLLFLQFFIEMTFGIKILVWISAIILFAGFCIQLSCHAKNDYYYLFIQFNCYLFSVMAILIGERLFL
jgi:protoheme IX farnesyltransferase